MSKLTFPLTMIKSIKDLIVPKSTMLPPYVIYLFVFKGREVLKNILPYLDCAIYSEPL